MSDTNAPRKKTISCHYFLFPFRWDSLEINKTIPETSFDERTKLKDFEESLNRKFWEPFHFKIKIDPKDQYNTYNEYTYFYDYVRDVLAIDLNKEQESSKRFRYKLSPEKAIYQIEIVDRGHPYQLSIQGIFLTYYDSGVGYLAFQLENNDYAEPEDILMINDFGRRIYPQFLGTEISTLNNQSNPNFTGSTKGVFLANRIILLGVKPHPIEEDFNYYNNLTSLNGEPLQLGNHISELLGNKFKISTRYTAQKSNQQKIILNPILDDRMFVMCFYLSERKMRHLSRYKESKQTYSYLQDPFWYAFLFVDKNEDEITCKSIPMKEQLVKERTYDRWIGPEGHLFGSSRYSFVMVGSENWFNENIILNHFRFIYFQMATLALMQRASLLRFSGEVARVANITKSEKNSSRSLMEIRSLYQNYLFFINKINFREVTAQEQGIELYDQFRQVMGINAESEALGKEVSELHQYGMLLAQEESTFFTNQLTIVATIFLPFSVIGAIYGFSNYPPGPGETGWWWTFGYWVVFSIMVLVATYLFLYVYNLVRNIFKK